MNSKLTLTIEKGVIDKAKIFAKQKGRSLSDIIETYLELITSENDEINPREYSPIVTTLLGSFQEPKNFNYKKEIEDILSKKHMDNE